jgi:phytoene dehydrogenase-like protein
LSTYDVIMVGAGHNSLVCACYLAKAGKKVLVLERRDKIGGGLSTEEVTLPGFKHNLHSQIHTWIYYGPVFNDLRLTDYGFSYLIPPNQVGMPLQDGRGLINYNDAEKTAKSISHFSEKDSKTFTQLFEKYSRFVSERTIPSFYLPPPKPSEEAKAFAELEETEDGLEFIRIMRSSPGAVIDEFFEDEYVRAFWRYRVAVKGVPDDYLGLGRLVITVIADKIKPLGARLAIGGSNSMAQAMGRFVQAHGGFIRVNSEVERITVKDGVAKGVKLTDGTQFDADVVVSSIDAPGTFLRLVGEEHLDRGFVRRLRNYKWEEWGLFGVHLAVDERPKFKSSEFNPDISQVLDYNLGYDSPQEFRTHWYQVRSGEPPSRPGFECMIPTLFDPTQAPSGKHVVCLWEFAPYNLRKGGPARWDEIKEEYMGTCIKRFQEYAPNITDGKILGKFAYSPLDIEKEMVGMVGGGFAKGKMTPDQLGYLRPTFDLSRTTTPIKNLYLASASVGIGGGIHGSGGYMAANRIAEDLGIEKWWKPIERRSFISTIGGTR